MSWKTVALCDVCNQVKGKANKWLLIVRSSDSFTIKHWTKEADAWPIGSTPPNTEMICGERCLQTLLNEFLALRCRSDQTEKVLDSTH